MPAHSSWDFIKATYNDWSKDKASRLAASLAYYTVFSLAPMLVIAVVVTGFILRNSADSQAKVVQALGGMVAGVDQAQLQQMIQNASKHGSGILATAISILLLIYGASNVFAELQDSMNTIWEVKLRDDLSWWDTIKKRFVSVGMVFVIAFLLLVSLIISTILTAIAHKISGNDAGLVAKIFAYATDIIVSIAVTTLLFSGIFKFLPDAKVQFSYIWRGALLSAILFTAGKYLLSLYFTYSSAASVFGAAGSLAALLIWVYYSAQILFFGAEFTQVYAKQMGHKVEPAKDAVPMTAEKREQLGLPATKPGGSAVQGGPSDQRAPAPRRPTPVIIYRNPSKAPYAVAASAVTLGFLAGVAGWMKGKSFQREGLAQLRLKKRLEQLESQVRHGRDLRRAGLEMRIEDRLNWIDHRVRHANDRANLKSSEGQSWVTKRLHRLTNSL